MIEGLPITPGFLLGLSTGPVCMATCLPVVAPFAMGRFSGDCALKRWLFFAKFLVGRLVAYASTGLITGLAATRLGLTGTRMGVYAMLALSLLMIAYGLGAGVRHFSFCRLLTRGVEKPYFPYILGLLTGFSVCPPFLLALSYVMEKSADVTFALAFFLSFFCATSLYVLPVGLIGHLPRPEWMNLASRLAAVAAGFFFLSQAVFSLVDIWT